MALLAGTNAADPAAARVAGAGVAPASSGGAQQWVSYYTGPGAQEDFAQAIAVARNGSAVFVTGWSTSADRVDRDYATVAYKASTGAKLWGERYTGVGGNGGIAQSVAVDPAAKRVFVTGYSLGAGTATDYVTIAYNAVTGAQLWLGRYDGPGSGHDYASDVEVSPDGTRVFVTGSSRPGSNADYATVAYNAATGAQLWATRYSGPGDPQETAYSLAVGPGGKTVYVTGRSGRDIATVAYNAATGG
jgi:DNA-binding beta-propeller fold protein YncE